MSDEYEILEEYKNCETKILFKHNKCNNEFKMTPDNFLQGRRCPICWGHKKNTQEEIINKIKIETNDEFEVKSDFINLNSKIKIKHKICGYEWEITASNFLSNYNCPICSPKIKLTDEMYKYKINFLYNNEYKVCSKYTDIKSIVKYKHLKCGHMFYSKPSNFTKDSCPICYINNKKKNAITENEFKIILKNLTKNEYTLIGHFKNKKTKVILKHNIKTCQYVWKVTPVNFLFQGTRCPKCFGNFKKTDDEFKQEVFKLVGNEYTILDKYIDAKTKLHIRHNSSSCNYHIFYVTPNSFLSGHYCPRCKRSKGELKIIKYLQNNNCYFKEQYTFNGLIGMGGGYLKFDFAVFKNKEKNILDYLIEFDGEQHYKPVRFGGISKEKAYDAFIKLINNDIMKNEYCKIHNIKLIRIPYWDFDNIEKYLVLNK